MKFQKYGGWVIDYIAMAIMIFIFGIAFAIYVAPPNYAPIAMSFSLIFSIIIPFMIYCYDESGENESVIIATLANVARKLFSISTIPKLK